jgi:protein tyrosine phosphatase (PTP) superfamily phosphohydrolase (DUF442 family)
LRIPARRKTRIALALVLCIACGAALLWLPQHGEPKRFGVVEAGRLYRCGDITPHQLECVTRKYGVRTVLSLLNPDVPESVAEREAAERLGVRWVNVALPGNGASTPAEREQIRAVLFDPEAWPILVHCAAGTNRTGLAVGMYRLHRQGWTLEQVLREMREYGFEDLPRHQSLREALGSEWRAARSDREPVTPAVPP